MGIRAQNKGGVGRTIEQQKAPGSAPGSAAALQFAHICFRIFVPFTQALSCSCKPPAGGAIVQKNTLNVKLSCYVFQVFDKVRPQVERSAGE